MAKHAPQTATWNREDRDLLVELRTEQRSTRDDIAAVRIEIKEINTGITARLLNLESNAVSKIEIKGIGDDIESLKLWRSMLLGAWGVCTLILIPVAFAYFRSS
jgi:hypothetical protein